MRILFTRLVVEVIEYSGKTIFVRAIDARIEEVPTTSANLGAG